MPAVDIIRLLMVAATVVVTLRSIVRNRKVS